MKNGLKAEEVVLNYEKERLTNLGRSDLAELVEWVSKDLGDGLGYDIKSFDPITGEEVFIEVKGTQEELFNSFEISSNEYKQAQTLKGYKVYLASNINSDKPKISIISSRDLMEYFDFIPTSFKVTLNASYENTKPKTR